MRIRRPTGVRAERISHLRVVVPCQDHPNSPSGCVLAAERLVSEQPPVRVLSRSMNAGHMATLDPAAFTTAQWLSHHARRRGGTDMETAACSVRDFVRDKQNYLPCRRWRNRGI